jgi:hypothetical protein
VGLDRGRGGSAADRLSDHRRLEQQQQYCEHRLFANGDHEQQSHGAKHDGLRFDLPAAGYASRTDDARTITGRRKIS